MEHAHVNSGALVLTCAILSAKWSMELGASQLRQLLWGVAGLLLGPLALLFLYVRHLQARQANGACGSQWISGGFVPLAVEPGTRAAAPVTGHEVPSPAG